MSFNKLDFDIYPVTTKKINTKFVKWFSDSFNHKGKILFPALPTIGKSTSFDDRFSVLSSPFHGRSVQIDFKKKQEQKSFFFAKGIGWTILNGGFYGWHKSLGNLGILTEKAAFQEFKMSKLLTKHGLDVIQPIAVLESKPPMIFKSKFANDNIVIDLDQSDAKPSIFLYSSTNEFRVCDLYLMDDNDRIKAFKNTYRILGCNKNNFIKLFSQKLARNVAKLHNLNGHNYASSPHNIFLDGTLVDFEYYHLPSLPAIDGALKKNHHIWKEKEILGWIDTLVTVEKISNSTWKINNQESLQIFLDEYKNNSNKKLYGLTKLVENILHQKCKKF